MLERVKLEGEVELSGQVLERGGQRRRCIEADKLDGEEVGLQHVVVFDL